MNRIKGKEQESEENKCQAKKSNKKNAIKYNNFYKILNKRKEKEREREKTGRKNFLNFTTFHLSWKEMRFVGEF
jgi:hypothetical protein